jgi:hypothetical protein
MKGETMKRTNAFVLLVALFSITSCAQVRRAPRNNDLSIVGSGNVVSQTRPLSDFDTLEAGLSFGLSVRQGDEFSVVFVADDNLVDYLVADKNGTTLSFGLKDGYAYNISNVTMRVEVTMPELAELSLNGSSHATLDGFKSMERFEAELTGSASLTGELEADTTSLNVYGSAYVELAGSSNELRIDACGNSVTDLSDFRVKDAALDASCSSTVVVQVDGRLHGEVSQNSRVYYLGNPDLSGVTAVEHASVQPQQ